MVDGDAKLKKIIPINSNDCSLGPQKNSNDPHLEFKTNAVSLGIQNKVKRSSIGISNKLKRFSHGTSNELIRSSLVTSDKLKWSYFRTLNELKWSYLPTSNELKSSSLGISNEFKQSPQMRNQITKLNFLQKVLKSGLKLLILTLICTRSTPNNKIHQIYLHCCFQNAQKPWSRIQYHQNRLQIQRLWPN